MLNVLVAGLTACRLIDALPNSSPSYYSYSQNPQFDNIQSVPGVAAGPVDTSSIYDKLNWNGFSLVQTLSPVGNGLIPGLVPQSAPNAIVFSAGDTETIFVGTPQIIANYQDSSTAFFDLIYFFFACSSATEASITSLPVACNMTVTGFTPPPNSKQVGLPATFQFTPPGGTEADFVLAILPSYFKGLYNAVFTFQSANNALTAGLLDNVETNIYSKAQMSSR